MSSRVLRPKGRARSWRPRGPRQHIVGDVILHCGHLKPALLEGAALADDLEPIRWWFHEDGMRVERMEPGGPVELRINWIGICSWCSPRLTKDPPSEFNDAMHYVVGSRDLVALRRLGRVRWGK